MSAYAPPATKADVPALLRSCDIDELFKREPGWFERARVRRRLYAKGFPHPCEAGRWSPIAIGKWMEGAGANPDNVPPDVERRATGKAARKPPRRRPGQRAGGYADA